MFQSSSMVADNCHSSKRHKFVNFRLNFNYFELKTKWKWNAKLFSFSLNCIFLFSKQNKTFLLWNENKNKSEIKAEVKLICSWSRTTIQNRKSKINTFMASRLDERLLYSGSKLVDELNRKRAWVLSATALEFRDWVSLLLTTECWSHLCIYSN